jgi:hypothetical protein
MGQRNENAYDPNVFRRGIVGVAGTSPAATRRDGRGFTLTGVRREA